jgi:hypothetical protein
VLLIIATLQIAILKKLLAATAKDFHSNNNNFVPGNKNLLACKKCTFP